MSNDMELRLKITADGKVAVSVAGQVENSVADIGNSAQQATKSVSAMMNALSKSPNFDSKKLDGAKLAYGMSQAARAASAYQQQQAAANAKASEGARIYSDLVAKLTMTAGAYRSQQLALQGLNAEQIKHVRQLELQAAQSQQSSTGIGALAGRYFALYQVVQLFGKGVKTAASLEDIETRTRSLTGTAENYARATAFLDQTSRDYHKNVMLLSDSYASILTLEKAGILTREQGQKILKGYSNAASETGASNEQLSQSLFGMTQGFSSAVLHAEELSQVVEPIPGLMQELDKAAGLPAGGFRRLVNEGNVTSAMFRDTLIKALESYDGAATKNAGNINAKLTDVANSHTRLAQVLEKPLNDVLTPLLRAYTFSIDALSGAVNRFVNGPSLDQRILSIQKSINAHQNNGAVGSMIDDLFGYDVNLKKNQLDALLKQQNAGREKQAAADKADAEAQRKAAQLQVENDKRAVAEAAAAEAKKEADKKRKAVAEQAANKAKQEALKIEERYQALRDQARTSDQVFIDTVSEYTKAYNTRNISLEQYIMLLAKADDARDKSAQKANPTVQAVPHFTEGGQSLSAYSAADKAINTELYQAAKSAEEYDQWLNQIDGSLSKMGATSADVFDGALGGIHLLTGAFSDLANQMQAYSDAQAENQARLAEAQKDPIANSALIAKGLAKEQQLESDKDKAAIQGASRVAGAVANMYEKKSSMAKAFHALEMGLAVVSMAMDLKKTMTSIAAGAAKFFAQSGWLGFAGVAAMLGVMAAVGFSKSSTVSVGTAAMPTSPDSGTVLGDPTAKSESIKNTYELLQDIHAKEYRELRGINAGVAALKEGITNSITRLFQSGGLQLPPNLNTGSFSNAKAILPKDPIGQYLLNGLFGTTKREITGNGIYLNAANLAELMNGGQITGQQYTQITTTKKSWFSKKTTVSEIMAALDPQFTDALTKMFRGMGSSMLSMATEFGQDMTTAVNQYVIPGLKINLFGMTSDEMIKTLNNVLSTQLDTMTTQIFGSLIAKYQKLGEGMFETATRLVAEKAVVLDAIDLVGSTFRGDAVEMADGLVTLAGGIKEFQGMFQDYYSKFYSEQEQLANTTRRLIANLGDYGLMLPDTRQAYRDLVNAQQLDTQAGRERYNQLLSLAEAADTYYAANEKLRESMELLSKDTFATAVDYTRYLRLAQLSGISKADSLLPPTPDKVFIPTGLPGQTLPGINSGSTVTSAFTTVAQSNEAVAEQIRQLRIELQAQDIAIAQNTADMAKIMKRWEGDGLPATRVVA